MPTRKDTTTAAAWATLRRKQVLATCTSGNREPATNSDWGSRGGEVTYGSEMLGWVGGMDRVRIGLGPFVTLN
jgi:hypothetical protein